jgi:GH25 family lysozyme M1 (1,4-beta-N-acetylmuramidase)
MTANPNDSANYDDCGLDISHQNTDLDFPELAGPGGRKYCFVKITEGHTVQDDEAENHITGLIAAGVTRLGVYHFAHHGDVAAQMKNFLDTFHDIVANLESPPKFLFMLDLEVNATDPNPPRESDGLAMVQHLQNIGIPNPVIYCGLDFWSQKHSELATCPHLLAAYNDHPTSALPWRVPGTDTFGWDMWQYTGDFQGPFKKDIPGGGHGMDLSCFNLKKHPLGLAAWWDAQLALTSPNIV